MKILNLTRAMAFLITTLIAHNITAQEKGIKELDFLIGVWETREDNVEEGWWETSRREINYALKENYIELKAKSVDSNGREREYSWFINYNKKTEQFQMVSMFSNWYKTQFDVLVWDADSRKLTIRNKPDSEAEYHERFGEIIFSEDFKEYTWKGENKYGDPNDPGVWRYVEKGVKVE